MFSKKFQIFETTLPNLVTSKSKSSWWKMVIFFKKIERSDYNSMVISTCYDKSDALSHDVLRVVSLDKLAILHRTSSGKQLM